MNRWLLATGSCTGAILLLAFATAACAATPSKVETPKKPWSQAMLAARASYLELQAQQQALGANPNAKPFTSESISGEGPGQKISVDVSGCSLMVLNSVVESGGGNCHIWGDARLVSKDGSVTRLSSLKPLYARVGWGKLEVDQNWQNRPLQIGAQKFQHGIWVHAPAGVAYVLQGKYQRFEAWIGMDAARPIGTARFKVQFVDNEELAQHVWQLLMREYPRPGNWFYKAIGYKPGRWFDSSKNLSIEHWLINQALGKLGPEGDPLREQFESLRRAKVLPSDRRWLDLFERTYRYAECCAQLGPHLDCRPAAALGHPVQ